MTDPQHGSVARWQRALLPGGLYERSSGGRSLRDWFVDVTMLSASVVIGIVALADVWSHRGPVENGVDIGLGAIVCTALWLRRRRPVAVAAAAVAASAFSAMAGGAGLIAIFSALIRAPARVLVFVVAGGLAASIVFPLVNPQPESFLTQLLVGVLLTTVVTGWGLFVRVRRELIGSLRDRAERVESEQHLRLEQAREAERRRIAREMHDVLAHRLSLLSVHAGALEFRPDATADEVAQAAGVIRTAAATALEELRDVIGVLREGTEEGTQPPQPTLTRLPALLEESRLAGMNVRARVDAPGVEALPDALGRTAYRVVQEGLTNARKHAPNAAVDVRIVADGRGGPVVEVVVEVVSRRPVGVAAPAAAEPAGAGAGLIGLGERLALVGGELGHGTDEHGDFVLRARLPVPR